MNSTASCVTYRMVHMAWALSAIWVWILPPLGFIQSMLRHLRSRRTIGLVVLAEAFLGSGMVWWCGDMNQLVAIVGLFRVQVLLMVHVSLIWTKPDMRRVSQCNPNEAA